MSNVISTDKAPAAIGPYSQAREFGGMILTSDDLSSYEAEDTVTWNTIHSLRQANIKDIYTKDKELILEYELYKQPQRLKISLIE